MSNFGDTLFRFLDILAVCSGLYGGLMFVAVFRADWRYTDSRAQILDRIQGRVITYRWGRFLILAGVSAAWLLARHW